MSNKIKANLTSGNILDHLIKLSLPMSFGIFTIIGFNMADTFFVGQLGHKELAAMAFTFPIPMLLGAIGFGIGTSVSSFTSRAVGSGNIERVKVYATSALLLGLILVIPFGLIGRANIVPLFKLMGANEEVMPFIKEYMNIWFFSPMFVVIPMIGNSVIRSMGNSKHPAIIMSIVGLVNLVLDPILIFGLGPIPSMRLEGAALATLAARIMAMLGSLYILHFKYRILINPLKCFSKLLKAWKNLLSLSIPASLTHLITPISMGIVTKMVSAYGNSTVAGFGVGSRIESFLSIFIIGLSAGLGPFVGQNYGAKKFDRIFKALNYACIFPVLWSGICLTVVFFFSNEMASLFNDNPQVIKSAREYLLIITIGIIGQGILQNVVSVFNALGRPTFSLAINILKMFVVYLPYAFLLKNYYDQYGIYMAGLTAHLLAGSAAYFYMKKFGIEMKSKTPINVS